MKSPNELRHELGLCALPDRIITLLDKLNAPQRLIAHLILVHDTAFQLVDWMSTNLPSAVFDSEAVLFGAALHDIGKILYPEELIGSGHRHEEGGLALLLGNGVELRLARFAQTHGTWASQSSIGLDDLLVALADTCWKGKRNNNLEQRIVDTLAIAGSEDRWNILLRLDDIVENLAADADARLAWQAKFPIANNEVHER